MTTNLILRCTSRRHYRIAPGFLLLWLLGASAAELSVVGPLWATTQTLRSPVHPMAQADFQVSFYVPGVREPAVLPASQAAALGDDEPVVGVYANGRHRAYLLRAMATEMSCHVVNDVVGGVPISVTHCPLHDCTRVFTGDSPDAPLDLSLGGLKAGSMVLWAGDRHYRQDSGAPLDAESPTFPYASYPADMTTWGTWRRQHPDTDLSLGGLSVAPPSQHSSAMSWHLPSPFSTFLFEALAVSAVPISIVFVTLLIHIFLTLLLRQPRRSETRPRITWGIRATSIARN